MKTKIMRSGAVKLIESILRYLTVRERNLNTRTLIRLYEEERKLIKEISDSIGDVDINPSHDYLMLTKHQLISIRKQIKTCGG